MGVEVKVLDLNAFQNLAAQLADETRQLISKAQSQGSPYTVYAIDTENEWDLGVGQLPVAGTGASRAAIVDLHDPVGRKIVYWTAERAGAKPVLPHWDTGNANERLAYKNITPASHLLTYGNKPVWRASGVYLYYLERPLPDNYALPTGAPPPSALAPGLLLLDGSLFSRDVLRAGVIRGG